MQKVETFGEMLRKLRETNEMPLRKLAALLDLDQSTLSKIERNERNANADLIEKVAKIFKVSKKDFCQWISRLIDRPINITPINRLIEIDHSGHCIYFILVSFLQTPSFV